MTDEELDTARAVLREAAKRSAKKTVREHGTGREAQEATRTGMEMAQIAAGAYFGLSPQESLQLGRPTREAYAQIVRTGVDALSGAVDQVSRIFRF